MNSRVELGVRCRVVLVAGGAFLLGAGLSSVRADILASGNTFLDALGQLDATDNWAVVRTDQILSGMIADFVPGTGSPAFDAESTLTFIYQIANNGGGTQQVDKLRQACEASLLTSWGYFADWGLTDAGNPVGIAENMGIDTWPAGGGNMRFGGAAGFVKNVGAYANPSSTTIVAGASLDWLEWFFNPALEPESGVSSLLISTTRVSDWWSLDELIHEPNCTWVGDFDNPSVPEPGMLALLGFAGAGLLRRCR